jgi:hypothetical protein
MLLGAAYGTVSDIEVLWTLIAAVGLSFSIFNVREAVLDRKALILRGVANGRKMLAQTNYLSEIARLVKQSIFLIIGIAVMFVAEQPDSLDQPWYLVVLGIAIRWGLIVASLLTALQSFLGFRARRILQAGERIEH